MQSIITDSLVVAVLTFLPIIIKGVAGATWSCPAGWSAYTDEEAITCVWRSYRMTSSMYDAHETCVSKNASLIVVNSAKKLAFFKANVQEGDFWLGLQNTGDGMTWLTKDGSVTASLPPGLQIELSPGEDAGVFYNKDRFPELQKPNQYYYGSTDAYYLCERPADCNTGYFGSSCEKACHCYGISCDTSELIGTCRHGCEVGWMGTGCDQPKEDATIKYYCVKSPDLGDYVHVRIYTKGVRYDKIQPLDDHGNYVEWCNSTKVKFNEASSVQTIKIFTDDKVVAEMQNGQCPGNVSNQGYSWHIKMQEKAGFVSRNDQEFYIACDQFTVYDPLSISAKVAVDVDQKQVELIGRQREGVTLKVADAFSGETVATKAVGSPVALKIVYGLSPNSDAAGVVPYNCEAVTANGGHRVKLLDAHGCPYPGSVLSMFHNNGSKSLVTDPFPLISLPGTKQINFKCSYTLCYDDDPCTEGCQSASNFTVAARQRRSAGPEEHRLATSVLVEIPQRRRRTMRNL